MTNKVPADFIPINIQDFKRKKLPTPFHLFVISLFIYRCEKNRFVAENIPFFFVIAYLNALSFAAGRF